MKKIYLLCATVLACCSLAACESSTKQQSSTKNDSTSTKVIKKHNNQKQSKKKAETSSNSTLNNDQNNQPSTSQNRAQLPSQASQKTATSNGSQDTNPASNTNYDPSELHKNAQAAIGSDGLIHGRIYGSNGYWIDADASRQGLADAGMPNSDQDIINHAETGNAMWNAGQNAN